MGLEIDRLHDSLPVKVLSHVEMTKLKVLTVGIPSIVLARVLSTSGEPVSLYASASSAVSQKLLAIASARSPAMKMVSPRNPFCRRRIGMISLLAIRVSSVAELALSFIVTCRPNIFLLLGWWLLTVDSLELIDELIKVETPVG